MNKITALTRMLLIFTPLAIILYWAAVFMGFFSLSELVPGYKNWFLSFPLADIWIAFASIKAFLYIKRKQSTKAIPWLAAAGSGLLFLGIYAASYGHNTGLLYILTVDEIIEIVIKIYCIVVGVYLINLSTKLIQTK